jgi:hypothetical protein
MVALLPGASLSQAGVGHYPSCRFLNGFVQEAMEILGEVIMEPQKFEVMKKLDGKGLTLSEAAKIIGFDPELLKLYFAQDSYPVPQRILDKLAEAVNN